MVEAAEEALGFVAGKSREDLEDDRKLALALMRLVEIVGEAASRVDAETRQELPSIPWPDVVGMRNRLVHAYFEVDEDRLWTTVRRDLPPLVDQIRAHLSASSD